MRMKVKKLLAIVPLSLVLVCEASATKVTDIKYIGCERIEQETISTYLPIKVGDDCDAESINDALKALKKTIFSYLDLKQGGFLKIY